MKSQVYKKVGRRYVPIGYSDGWAGIAEHYKDLSEEGKLGGR